MELLLHAGRWFDDRPWVFVDRPWWGFLGWLLPLLVVAGLVALAVWLVVRAAGRPAPAPPAPPARDAALEQARLRYARGEIDRDTFLQLSRDLGGEVPPGG